MKSLPGDVQPYKRTAVFTQGTVPAGLLKDHTTKEGTWALIRVQEGALEYVIEDKETHTLSPGHDGVVEPQVRRYIRPLGAVRFFVEFYRNP